MRVHAKSLRSRQTATPWNAAHQAPLSTGFFRQECWNGLPFSSPGDLPDRGIKPGQPAWQTGSSPSEPPGKPLKMTCARVHAKLLQMCPTLCDPMDSSPSGSSVYGILQARILEWVAIPFSRDLPT